MPGTGAHSEIAIAGRLGVPRRVVTIVEGEALEHMRNRGEISDDVLRHVEQELDLEERRLSDRRD